jgi:N-acyl-L-homoserine lactone synthetase
MDLVHALRYRVYCKEKGFLDAKKYPDGTEYDSFDAYSVHIAAYDRDGQIAGTLRLVIPKEGQPFPFESFCKPFPDHEMPPKGTVAEISRLIIAPEFRVKDDQREFSFRESIGRIASRWRGGVKPQLSMEAHTQGFTRVAPAAEQSTSPRILLGLFRKVYRFSQANGIIYVYAAMEVPLARMLRRYQIVFHRVSPSVDYYGPVTLYIANLLEVERRLAAYNPDLLRWMQKSRPPKPASVGVAGLSKDS